MRTWHKVLGAGLLMGSALMCMADKAAFTGKWQTFDEKTKKLNSIITIKKKHNAYVGSITKIYAQEGHKTTDVCTKCKGQLHNKPILGMNILHFKVGPNGKPQGCKVLDPTEGALYHCQLALLNHGAQLQVHGYIGLPIIGRSETWQRSTLAKPKPQAKAKSANRRTT